MEVGKEAEEDNGETADDDVQVVEDDQMESEEANTDAA